MTSPIPFLVGTYTERLGHVHGRGPGIVPCSLDPVTGGLRVAGEPTVIRNPACLWRNAMGNRLHATSEIYDFGGKEDGCITTLAVDGAGGTLTRLQETSSAGSGPAWVQGDRTGRWLFVANYIAGRVAVFPLQHDGTPERPSCVVRHAGSGPNASRQEGPHPHAILASPDNRQVYVADLGTDTVHGYDFDASTGAMTRSETATLRLPPGSGPRHFLFHPNGRLLFLVLELSSGVAVIERNAPDGSLRLLGRWSTLPSGCEIENHPSELALTNDGRFLYVANRGHDSLALFKVNPNEGTLEFQHAMAGGGRTPRHMALSPDNRFLIVANQDSDEVAVFSRDVETGRLDLERSPLAIPTPCFVCFQSP